MALPVARSLKPDCEPTLLERADACDQAINQSSWRLPKDFEVFRLPFHHDTSCRHSPFSCYDSRRSELHTRSFRYCIATESLLQHQYTASRPLNALVRFHPREVDILQEHPNTNKHGNTPDYGAEASHLGVCEDAADFRVRIPESACTGTCDSKLTYAQQILWKPWRSASSRTTIQTQVLESRAQEGRSYRSRGNIRSQQNRREER